MVWPSDCGAVGKASEPALSAQAGAGNGGWGAGGVARDGAAWAYLLQRRGVTQDDRGALVVEHVHVDVVDHLDAVLRTVEQRRGKAGLALCLCHPGAPLLVAILAALHSRQQPERSLVQAPLTFAAAAAGKARRLPLVLGLVRGRRRGVFAQVQELVDLAVAVQVERIDDPVAVCIEAHGLGHAVAGHVNLDHRHRMVLPDGTIEVGLRQRLAGASSRSAPRRAAAHPLPTESHGLAVAIVAERRTGPLAGTRKGVRVVPLHLSHARGARRSGAHPRRACARGRALTGALAQQAPAAQPRLRAVRWQAVFAAAPRGNCKVSKTIR
jgi:hypothetical protein